MINCRYLAVEGVIGAGKTTLARMLAADWNASLLLESFEENEFLSKFYSDRARYAFPLEMAFLADRYRQLQREPPGSSLFHSLTVADYLLSKSLVFARTNLRDDEYRLFRELFDIMFQSVPVPDLLVYLYLPTEMLQEHIARRGRIYETKIEAAYLATIHRNYMEIFEQLAHICSILILDVSKADFVKWVSDYEKVKAAIKKPRSKGIQRQVI